MSDSQHSNGKVSDEPEQFRKLFIGGLSLNTTDESLRDFYGTYGDIVDCIVMKDGATKKSRGFGFVTYSSKAGVDEAMKNRPHTIDGKTVDPKRAVPRDQSSRGEANISTQRLYVSGVREEHNEEIFRDYFKDFGTVTKVSPYV
jgi:RNA recognition motif-containing protein